ncbi:MAG: hypothetical protein ABJF01_11215 [bacterium]
MNPKQEPPPSPGSTPGVSSQWLKSNLVALGSAAVFSVYGAGYLRTRSAAQRFADEGTERRRPAPAAAALPVATAARTDTSIAMQVGAAPAPQQHAASKPSPKPRVAPPAAKVPNTSAPARSADSTVAPPPTAVPATTPAPTAPASPTAATQTDSAAQADKDHPHYHDGIFTGWGTSRHGDIQASVEIKGGRIIEAFVSICLTRYSCSIIASLPPQVIARQSADVDFVSGATQSTNAFYYAVVEALNKAK